MNWDRIALFTSDILGLALATRFLALRLHRVYRVFCVFLLFDLLSSTIYFAEVAIKGQDFNYNLQFVCTTVVSWFLTLWMVYALLDAILTRLPGILRFSRHLLNGVFAGAVLIALLAVQPRYTGLAYPAKGISLAPIVRLTVTLERVISTTALIVLLTILVFVLWFPVQMPRNLVIFSSGFIAYFFCETLLLFAHGILPPYLADLAGPVVLFLLGACYAFWGFTITRDGESVPVRIGHSWQVAEQTRLLGQLEAMNASLLRGVRR